MERVTSLPPLLFPPFFSGKQTQAVWGQLGRGPWPEQPPAEHLVGPEASAHSGTLNSGGLAKVSEKPGQGRKAVPPSPWQCLCAYGMPAS